MNTTTDLQADADRALKAKHRIVWALGDYAAVAREVIPELGRVIVAESGVGPGDRPGRRQRRAVRDAGVTAARARLTPGSAPPPRRRT